MQLVYGHEKVKLEKIKEIIKGSKLVCKETNDFFEKTKQREIREVRFHIFSPRVGFVPPGMSATILQ